MKDIITTVLELLGVALVVTGVAMWSIPVAFIVAGVAVVGLSYLLTIRGGRS